MVRANLLVWISCIAAISAGLVEAIGVNWGTIMSHQMLPSTVVQMLKDNGINKVKLFDADEWTVEALVGSEIEVMLAIPNDQLAYMNKYDHAKEWVKKNVTKYNYQGGVNIKYVAVGNEPFLKSYNGSFMTTTFPALKNIQQALNEAGIGDRVKATIPLNADVYSSPSDNPVPSAGNFRSDIRDLMVDIVRYLHSNGSPFVVNIYPFLSLYSNANFPIDFAFFDGNAAKTIDDKGIHYTNVFDANFDTLVWSLKKSGVPGLDIIVGEVGWPTDGDKNGNLKYAKRFYDGLLKKLGKKVGTPLKPGKLNVYLFGLIDEDMKSVLPGNFERHWGIFSYDGKPKFPMDLTGQGEDKYLKGAKGVQYLPSQWCVLDQEATKNFDTIPSSVNYACSIADCTSLGYGSSCNGLGSKGNISYAFNMYFQTMDQDVRACNFEGLGKITTTNASQGGCLFPVQILSDGERTAVVKFSLLMAAAAMAVLVLGF